MLLLKANPELKKVFEKMIKTMKLPVTWTDVFVIMNNNLILAGEIRSLIFSFDSRKIYTNIVEIPDEGRLLEPMPSDSMLNNAMNMTLYTFGKWGLISGLKVQKNYRELNALFEDVLRPVRIEPGFSADNFRFFKNNIQITYEDTMIAVMRLLKGEGKLKEKQSLVTSDVSKDNPASPEQNDHTANSPDSPDEDDYDYEIGLWHNLRWKNESCIFRKCSLTDKNPIKSRIGNDFYIANYQCPVCSEVLYMGVYPTDRELLIDTEEGRVFMARTYACHNCNTFYTPRPGKLLQEGDVYSLKFDDDRSAYEDYLDILGSRAERINNYKFNEFEADRIRGQRKNDTGDMENIPDSSILQAGIKGIKEQLAKSGEKRLAKNKRQTPNAQAKNAQMQKAGMKNHGAPNAGTQGAAESGSRGQRAQAATPQAVPTPNAAARNTTPQAVPARNAAARNTTSQAVPAPNTAARNTAPQAVPARNAAARNTTSQAALNGSSPKAPVQAEDMQEEIARLSQKTTEELKNILSDLLYKNEIFKSDHKDSISDSSYVGAVKKTLQQKLIARYDTFMGSLDNFSLQQLYELKKQIGNETALPEEKSGQYMQEINSRLYKAEENVLAQQVEASKKKTYHEIVQIIEEIEKKDIPDEFKEEPLQKLYRIKNDRAKREVEYLLTHMPLHLNRKQLSSYLDKLEQYKGVDITPYRKQLIERQDMAEKEEISAFVNRGNQKDRNTLWKIYEQLKKQDYKEENKAPFLEKIYDRVQLMDEMKIEKICPSIAALSFSEGLRAYEQINREMLLPELKTNTLEMIQRRLTKLKTDESVQLMRKLKHDLEARITDLESFYFYDAREEQKSVQDQSETPIEGEDNSHSSMLRAINGYASARGEYEYPLMVCDTSRSRNGKEGYVLTPDHIFYHTLLNSGVIDITDIEKIWAGKKLFGKGIFISYTGAEKEKLPNNLKPKNWEPYAKVLDDFIHYLQEKPDSRSLEYLAKDKHDVIHCYRCGHTYRTGNICPKCGSKMNR